MNKIELVRSLQAEAEISKPEAAEVVNIFFNAMADALSREERVEIRGLFSFYVKEYDGYVGRNPKTGKKVQVNPKRLPFFKCGNELKGRLNKS